MVSDSEETYLKLYDAIVDYDDYLQTNSLAARKAISDDVVIAALSAILVAFSNGFLGRLGQNAADGVLNKVKSSLGKRDPNDPHAAVIAALNLLQPYLAELQKSSNKQRREEESWIVGELVRLGLSKNTADLVAKHIIAILSQQ
jgi:hypothetical protein